MYKLSKYNYVLPYNGRYVYYNGISRQIFSLGAKEHEKMQALFQDLIAFETYYTSVFYQFKAWRFIIDESIDEVDILRHRNKMEIYEDRSYRLFINPTLECNFACWYCYEKHPEGRMSPEVQEKLKKCMKHLVADKRIDRLMLSWFGGEPLLYFDEVVYPLSLYGKQLCEKYHIPFHNGATTNASRINEAMVEKMKEIGMTSFQITIDGDEKRHDKIRNEKGKPSFRKIMDNVILLCENLDDVYITLRVNYDNQTLRNADMAAVFNEIPMRCRHKICVDFQRVWQTASNVPKDNVERKDLHQLCDDLGFSHDTISNSFMLGGFHKCYSDRYHYAEINYDGKVYRCTARGYDDKYVMGELGEDGRILWDEAKIAKCLGKATFENEMCLTCKYLPLCMGPCSQKMLEVSKDRLQDVCYLRNCEITPEDAIIDYYKQKMKMVKGMQMSEAKPQAV